jgi:hypothetical protein
MEPANFNEDRPTTFGTFQMMLGLQPRGRVIVGMASIAGGVLFTVLSWNRGILWGLPVFFAFAGILVFFSGLAGLRREKDRRERIAAVSARREELLEAMIAEKREGRNPIRWLNDQGFHDADVRSFLIEAMNERLRRPAGK